MTSKATRRRLRYPHRLGSCVSGAVTLMRETARRAAGRGDLPSPDSWRSGREVADLGRIVADWESLVGRDVRRWMYPRRLIRGTLHIVCRDSGAMNTLTFLKPQIRHRLAEKYPSIKIEAIIGRLGPIPDLELPTLPADWPAWHVAPLPLSSARPPDCFESMQRCRGKLRSRIEGLRQEGWELCGRCQAVAVRQGRGPCAVCRHRERLAALSAVLAAVRETPWMMVSEARRLDPALTEAEFDLIRGDAFEEVRLEIENLLERFHAPVAQEAIDRSTIRHALIRAAVLQNGLEPHQVDLDAPSIQAGFEAGWVDFLNLPTEESDVDSFGE
jgi:hypothetical protein